MAVHKASKAAQGRAIPAAAGKENLSPRKTKRTVSISTLFEQKHNLKRKAEKDARDVLAPKASGVYKQYANSRKSDEHPVYRKFLGATKDYRDGVAGSQGEQVEPVYDELIARVDGLAVSGNDTTSGAQMDALAAEHARLANPLGEDKIEIQRTRADGSTVAQERKLSDTMTAFERVLDQKRNELEQLLRELKDVDAEIAAVKHDVTAVEQKEVKKLKRGLDSQVAALIEVAEAGRATTVAEIEKARKEDKKATELQTKKFEEFMSSVF